MRRLRPQQSFDHLLQNRNRVLAAWVVAGQYHLLRLALRDGRHQRTLARVAITATSDHHPQSATTSGCHGLQSLQRLFQSVRGVGVVNQHQRLIFDTLADALHASRHRGQAFTRAQSRIQWDTQSAGGSNGAQHVAHVVLADQRKAQGTPSDFSARCVSLQHLEAHTTLRVLHTQRRQARASVRPDGNRP